MGVGLQPLEFTDCLADSPQFRENLQRHEKELERTSQQIKRLIKEVKDVVNAARRLGSAQLALATSMEQLEFTCLGASMTEDERVISKSLHHCAALIRTIEDERDRMLNRANEQIIQPLENFRKEHIGAVKEGKKKFEKKSAKLCQMQERTLALSPKRGEVALQEADAQLEMMERDFCAASLDYVRRLHALHERKKYELVETMLGFVFGWWTFHHTAHDVHHDAEPLVRDLQLRIQRNKESESELDDGDEDGITKAGYLYLMEKKAFGTTTWNKHYVTYRRRSRTLTMLAYTQLAAKNIGVPESFVVSSCREVSETELERRWVWEAAGSGSGSGSGSDVRGGRAVLQAGTKAARAAWIRAIGGPGHAGNGPTWLTAVHDQIGVPESFVVSSCREVSETELERRWVWEAAGSGSGSGSGSDVRGGRAVLQAGTKAARAAWIRAIGGPGHAGNGPTWLTAVHDQTSVGCREDRGSWVVETLVRELESRGLREAGLYRAAGVASRVTRLLASSGPPVDLHDPLVYDTKVLCSAIKTYLRNLPEPLLTTRLHHKFIDAAKLETRGARVSAIAALVRLLPPNNRRLLQLVMAHLTRVVAESSHNLMSASNLAVCFGPTLLRAERETVASILEIKFYNVVVETMLDHYHEVFSDNSEYASHQSACIQYAAPLVTPLNPPLLPPPPPLTYPATRVRTLYACVAESEGELSFEPNQVITNVTHSGEPGWLRGELRGHSGLVPQNYVEPLP